MHQSCATITILMWRGDPEQLALVMGLGGGGAQGRLDLGTVKVDALSKRSFILIGFLSCD